MPILPPGDYLIIRYYSLNNNNNNNNNYWTKCGADHVKSTQSPPRGLELIKGQRYVSLDGDADRIVFYYFDGNLLPLR